MSLPHLCCYMYFTLLAAVLSNEQIIHKFYHKLDTHSKWRYILPSLCNDFHNISAFETYFHQHIKYHMNEQNSLSLEKALQQINDQIQTFHVNMEYSGLKWPNHGHETICHHYNYTVNISINILLRCIESIQRGVIYHYFEDHNSSICYSKTFGYHPLNINNNNNNKFLMDTDDGNHTFSGFTFNFLDTSNVKLMSFGILSCITWTLFYIIYHIALLNYPSIYYTKTCVFTLFLASLANLTLSISLQDPFSFIPNSISIILCILQFSKYSYSLIFNFNAYSLSKFVRFKKETNTMSLIESNEFSNNFKAKYNPNSIPNRRKKMLYEKQERMKANLEINFDNKEWMRQSVISDTASNIDRFKPNNNTDKIPEYRSRVKDKYRGHGQEKIEIKVFSIIFLLISFLLHYLVIFLTEIFERNDTYRFNIIHGFLLLQWMLCLTFLITWYQNYRFEYAIDQLLSDGYSLYYLLKNKNTKLHINESLNDIASEMETLSMNTHPSLSSNDINLPTQQTSSNTVSHFITNSNNNNNNNNKLKEEDEEYSDISDPDDIVINVNNKKDKEIEKEGIDKISKCCYCLRFISIFLLKLIRYLPWILLLNACCWVFFGVYICDIEVIWLQHSISIGVSGIYIIFSFCMNEKHLILQKETQIVPNHYEEKEKNNRNIRTRKIKKKKPKKALPAKPLPVPLQIKPLPPSPIHIK